MAWLLYRKERRLGRQSVLSCGELSRKRWPAHILLLVFSSAPLIKCCLCVCLDVNHGGTIHNRCTQRLNLACTDLLMNCGRTPETRLVRPTLMVKIPPQERMGVNRYFQASWASQPMSFLLFDSVNLYSFSSHNSGNDIVGALRRVMTCWRQGRVLNSTYCLSAVFLCIGWCC